MFRTFETTLAGRPLVIETGKMAQLANGHCLVRYGDTVVMVNVTASRSPREGVDFFPLSVDYEEKLYSVGKIPGGYIKREGKPSEKAILTSRVIDRPIRPLFPSDLRNDVSVVATVLSVEQDNPPEVAAMIGTSIAISISDVPWNGPIGGVWLGLVDGEYVINPTVEQREKSEMLVTVAGTKQKVVMIEAGANEVEESVMLEGIKFAHKHIIELCDFISGIQAEIGKEKFTYESHDVDHDLYDAIKNMAFEKLQYALDTDDKNVRDERIGEITDEIIPALEEQFPDKSAKFFTKCKRKSFVHGLFRADVLTAEALMKSDRLRQKLTCFREHTAAVCLQEDKLKCFQLLHLLLFQKFKSLTVSTLKKQRDISITITSRHTQ